jgi:hypothetical protein
VKISELLDSIRKYDLVLPEFQREYVWTREQAKQLMVSLVKSYPVGGLLVWKTDRPPELKNVAKLPERLGRVQVLLDGQQRLTTLHMLITGDLPSYYTEAEIENDPRDLYVHLRTLDFQFYQRSKMQDDPCWQRLIDCFETSSPIRPIKIAQAIAKEGEDALELAEILMDNLTKIRAVKEVSLPLQLVPPHASLDEAIDIFDRVNSQGTKLTDAELALTHVTGKWPLARRRLKEKMSDCAVRNFNFSLTFMTRALVTVVCRRALYETIHPKERPELEAGWKRVSKILDYLLSVLPSKMFIHSTDDLNTTNALVPLVAYLSLNDGKFPNEKALKHAQNWLYAALMWARYTAQTDQRLEADVQLVVREAEPWEALRANIVEQRGRIEVKASDMEGRTALHPLYRMVYVLAKAHGAVDWFNGAPLGTTHGDAYGLNSHHIFPQSVLYRNGWDADNYIHRQAVNEIGNRAFLTASTNLEISNKPPADYLGKIEDTYPGALAAQFVPVDPNLWAVERYRDFIGARRELIARKLNEFMNSLISQPQPPRHRPIGDLIKLGESYVLEFKSTLQWDVIQGKQNNELRNSSLKTIAAFLNSQGGTLVIGVEDGGAILGLEHDLKLLNGSRDKFEQLLTRLVTDTVGAGIAPLYRLRFEGVDGKEVCIVDVERASEPIFLKTDKGKQFFVRVGNTTRALDHEEMLRYIETNWA